MKQSVKELFLLLLKDGHYVRTRMNHDRESVYVVYTGKQDPVKSFPRQSGDALKNFFKKNSYNNYTLNLTKVRQLDGRSFMKKQYKKALRNEKENAGKTVG